MGKNRRFISPGIVVAAGTGLCCSVYMDCWYWTLESLVLLTLFTLYIEKIVLTSEATKNNNSPYSAYRGYIVVCKQSIGNSFALASYCSIGSDRPG